MKKFPIDVVERHIRKNHPGCPEFAVAQFSKKIAERDWRDASLGKAVGITLQTFLRHEMTDYDTLLLHGMDRAEAMRRVQPRVRAMLKNLRRKPERPDDPASSEGEGVGTSAIQPNIRTPPRTDKDQPFSFEEATGDEAEIAAERHANKRVGMTFNMKKNWHTRFKLTAISRGVSMRQLLIEIFAAWERAQKEEIGRK